MAENTELNRRVLKSKEAVLRNALELLCEEGLAGFSIDEVSARSGVAKTTVYRHWPSRASLLIDTCSQLGKMDFGALDTGTLRGDLVALGREIGAVFQSAESSILPSIMDAAERDSEIAGVFAVNTEKISAAFRKVVSRAVKRRELARGTDVDTLVASLVGPLAYRRWFSRKPISDAFIKGCVDGVLEKK